MDMDPLVNQNQLPDSPNTQESSSSPSMLERIAKLTTLAQETYKNQPHSYWIQLSLSSTAMLTTFPAFSILFRLYYSDGGQSKWIISWAAAAGWPLTAVFLILVYFHLKISPTPFTFTLFIWYIILGFLSAADNLMYAWAFAYLPASTASLLAASSLVFSSLFGYFIVKNKLKLSSINAIMIITSAAVIIGLDSESDKYPGISDKQYNFGFIWDIIGSALYGLIFALREFVFEKFLGRRSFHVVLEQQVMVSFSTFVFTSLGTWLSGDFGRMRLEARGFKNGEVGYAMVLFWSAVTFQLGVLGGTAVLFLASTVLAGVLTAASVPVTSVAAVIYLSDPMSGFKILSLVLTVWGFGSYIVGHCSTKRDS